MLQRYVTRERFDQGILASAQDGKEQVFACCGGCCFFLLIAIGGTIPAIDLQMRSDCDHALPLVQEVDCFPRETLQKNALHHLAGCDVRGDEVGAFDATTLREENKEWWDEGMPISILGNLSSGEVLPWVGSSGAHVLFTKNGAVTAARMLQDLNKKNSTLITLIELTMIFLLSLPLANCAFFPGKRTSCRLGLALLVAIAATQLLGTLGCLIGVASLLLVACCGNPEVCKIVPLSAAALGCSVCTSYLTYMLGFGTTFFPGLGVAILVLYFIPPEYCAGLEWPFGRSQMPGYANMTASIPEGLSATRAEDATDQATAMWSSTIATAVWSQMPGHANTSASVSEPLLATAAEDAIEAPRYAQVEESEVPADHANATAQKGSSSSKMLRSFAIGMLVGLCVAVVLALALSSNDVGTFSQDGT